MSIIYNLLITPIEYIIEIVYTVLKRTNSNPVCVILGVSLVVNILILPIYIRADKIQEEENKRQEDMALWIKQIKKAFSKDECFMRMQAYYTEMGYKPIYALRSLLPTLLQIPFFLAAYHFLSNLGDLKGVAYGPIKDFSAPDHMVSINGSYINILPLVMTSINVISIIIYTKGKNLSFKEKIQPYFLAIVFLIILYQSPSCLAFYWICNNVFSLGKNIIIKIIPIKQKRTSLKIMQKERRQIIFIVQVFLTILIGIMIPATLISSSPTEFIVIANPQNPIHYLSNTFLVSAGILLVWFSVFYSISTEFFKKLLDKFLLSASIIAIIDFLFFGRNLGIISADLVFRTYPSFSKYDKILNLIVLMLLCFSVILLWEKLPKIAKSLYLVMTISIFMISILNIRKINREIEENSTLMESKTRELTPIFELSKTGKNVVILSMDSMIGGYVPYIIAEKPELRSIFDGFTYYKNTLSSGSCTAAGSPGMLGGYEYTPYYSNMRTDTTLEEKNYEYTTLMPILFSEAGWEVTACDLPYAGYKTVPDMSKLDELEGVTGINTMGYYMDPDILNYGEEIRIRNMFWYSVMKSMPVFSQTTIYDGGSYFSSKGISDLNGLYASHFMESYEVIHNLNSLTGITERDINTFFIMNNDMTHEHVTLRLPEYEPSNNTTSGDPEPGYRYDEYGSRLTLATEYTQPSNYHINMAAFLQIGKWLEYLKANGVYDNTRIIIVSDHGRNLNEFSEIGNPEIADIERFYCILLVKDFNEHGFNTSEQLMSNADTPTLAMKDVIDNPINPYTGNLIDSELKENGLILLDSFKSNLLPKDDYSYDYSDQKWIYVNNNIFDKDNWTW